MLYLPLNYAFPLHFAPEASQKGAGLPHPATDISVKKLKYVNNVPLRQKTAGKCINFPGFKLTSS